MRAAALFCDFSLGPVEPKRETGPAAIVPPRLPSACASAPAAIGSLARRPADMGTDCWGAAELQCRLHADCGAWHMSGIIWVSCGPQRSRISRTERAPHALSAAVFAGGESMESPCRLLRQSIQEKLSEERAGHVLGAGLVKIIATYLMDVCEIQDVSEVVLSDLKTTAAEAWAEMKGGVELPKIHEKAVARWVSGIAPKASLGPAPGSIYDDEEDEDDDDEILFGSINPTARDRTALEHEKTSQGLSGARILALSLAIELGRVPSPGEVATNISFKADPRMSELARKQRKAGIVV